MIAGSFSGKSPEKLPAFVFLLAISGFLCYHKNEHTFV